MSKNDAATAIENLLRETIAYGAPWLDADVARGIAEAYVACFGSDVVFATNGDLWRTDATGRAWTGLTNATFDAGVVGVDAALAGILWFVDED